MKATHEPPLNPVPKPKSQRPTSGSPIAAVLGSKTFQIRFLFLALVVLLVYVIIQPYLLFSNFSGRERIVILDQSGHTYSISTLLDFRDASALHIAIAEDAALAMLSRNPESIDRPNVADMLFLKNARTKLEDFVKGETPEFSSKQFHQKAEVSNIKITNTTDQQVIVVVSGQLIRSGMIGSRPITDIKKYDLRLVLIRNPNMLVNKRYPLCVFDFDIRY